MTRSKGQYKYIIISAILFFMTFSGFPGYAETRKEPEKLILSMDEAVNMAFERSAMIKKMDMDIKSLERKYVDLAKLSSSMETVLNEHLPKYIELLDIKDQLEEQKALLEQMLAIETDEVRKKELEGSIQAIEAQMAELDVGIITYSQMFTPILGPKDPRDIPGEEIFETFIKNVSFPAYDLEAAIESMKAAGDSMEATVEMGVRQLYDGILGMEEIVGLQEELFEAQQKQYEEANMKFDQGMISEIERYQAENSLEQLRLNIDVMRRSLDNLGMNLKQQIGAAPETELELKHGTYSTKLEKPMAYEEYLSRALKNRSEISSVQAELEARAMQRNLAGEYIDKGYLSRGSTELMQAQYSVNQKESELEKAKKTVTMDIKSKYMGVEEKENAIELAKKRRESAILRYGELRLQYEQGYIQESTLMSVKVGCTQAEIGYRKAVRDYYSALNGLKLASEAGPMDMTGMGVK